MLTPQPEQCGVMVKPHGGCIHFPTISGMALTAVPVQSLTMGRLSRKCYANDKKYYK